ncbi:putative transcription factor WD40-like family [Helianthus annuus]|nr:putative transcription factor WD40-like family [Helianthus annuus]
MTNLTASELNYMVFRYLQESGFLHTAFNFGHEADIQREANIDPTSVPPGALVTFVQSGIQYLEMKANLKIDDSDIADDFVFVKPFDLLNMNVEELKQNIEKNRVLQAAMNLQHLRKGKEREDSEIVGKGKEKIDDDVNYKLNESVAFGGLEPMHFAPSSTLQPWIRYRGVRSRDVLALEGHSAEVFACAWSPAGLVLASGSGDSTARIWRISDRSNSTSAINRLASMHVLRHFEARSKENRKGVLTLDWNFDGTLLATGSHAGVTRIWHASGEMKSILMKHDGPIFSVKWNKKGDCVLTGGFDRSGVVWDINTNKLIQQFDFHSGSILDVDWRTNRTFATGSTDTLIYICKIGESQPVKRISGHKDQVNCVKWDPSCMLLASCSDDTTAKIWRMEQHMPVHDFKDHDKEVYTIAWSPTGPATNNPNKKLLLASASLDSTVKLWDVSSGGLFGSLNGHRDAVYCLAFSPNGEYLATGSEDRLMNIWSVKDGMIVKTYFCKGSVSQVCWNKEGNKIAYGTRKNSVCISDFRM